MQRRSRPSPREPKETRRGRTTSLEEKAAAAEVEARSGRRKRYSTTATTGTTTATGTYGFDKGDIGRLFIAGFGSSMIFGTIVGSLADKQGRKRACITYCISYILSCITKHSPEYNVMMIGRILGVIATSLLFSAFESWQVAEHNTRGFDAQWLSLTFSKAIFLGNGLVAIVSGLFANMLADNLGFGPISPFDAAACFLTIGMAIIMLSWTKNYGDPSYSKDLMAQFKVATAAIASDEKIALLGAIQSLFEGSMYTFVFLWTPALSPNDEDIPHGFIFATFMLSSMLGSSIASRLMARPALKVGNYMQIVFAISAFTLLLPVVTTFFIASSGVIGGSISFAGSIQLLGFCTFEAVIASFYSMVLIIGGHVHSLPKDEQPGSDSSRTSIIICGVILCPLTLALTGLLGWHVYLILHNKTTVEYHEGVRAMWCVWECAQNGGFVDTL